MFRERFPQEFFLPGVVLALGIGLAVFFGVNSTPSAEPLVSSSVAPPADELLEIIGVVSDPPVFQGKLHLTDDRGVAYAVFTSGARLAWMKKGDRVNVQVIRVTKDKVPVEGILRSVRRASSRPR